MRVVKNGLNWVGVSRRRVTRIGLAVFFATVGLSTNAAAGTWEASAGLSYNHSDYGSGDFSWSRRWGASLGYHLTDLSEIEFSFQDVFDRTKLTGFEDTSFHDQVFSLNWVQSLLGKGYAVQPYVKAGIGQLNRDASGSYATGAVPPQELDEVTIIIGAGARFYLAKGFAFRAEATSYLTNGAIASWKDNLAVTLGFSLFY